MNEPAARGGGGGPNDIGADQQIHGVGGEGRAAAADWVKEEEPVRAVGPTARE